MHAAEHHVQRAAVALRVELAGQGLEGRAEESCHERGAGDVEVREVRAVALVQVVVGFEEGGMREDAHWREDRVGGLLGGHHVRGCRSVL